MAQRQAVPPPLPRAPVGRILATLAETYPQVGTALDFTTPFELLVATVLSAQCTDKLVNRVTPGLFAVYPTALAMAQAGPAEIEPLIARCGLFRTKAKNLAAAARLLEKRHGGSVPETMEALLELPGVGRKTANVVLSNAFGVPGIAVDTHVFRVARRLSLARGTTPEQVEAQLRRRIPRSDWADTHHRLIWHGRLVCHARSPECGRCPLLPHCAHGRALQRAGGTQPKAAAGPDPVRGMRAARPHGAAADAPPVQGPAG